MRSHYPHTSSLSASRLKSYSNARAVEAEAVEAAEGEEVAAAAARHHQVVPEADPLAAAAAVPARAVAESRDHRPHLAVRQNTTVAAQQLHTAQATPLAELAQLSSVEEQLCSSSQPSPTAHTRTDTRETSTTTIARARRTSRTL